MNIWIFRNFENLPLGNNERLMRTAILAEHLAKRNHEVTWFTSSFDHFKKTQRFNDNSNLYWNNVQIKVFKSIGYKKNISLTRLIDHLFLAIKVKYHILSSIKRPDIIYVSFPSIQLSKIAVQYARNNSIPCIVEIRDLWPDIFYNTIKNKFIKKIVKSSLFLLQLDVKFIFKNSSAIFGISEEYLMFGLKYSNRAKSEYDNVFPLGYNKIKIPAQQEQEIKRNLESKGVNFKKKIILYVGSSGSQYDWRIVNRIYDKYSFTEHEDFQFVFCGDGVYEKIQKKNTIYLGFIGATEISVLCSNSYIGLLPYVNNAPQGLPNKLFEYMAYGLPVLSSLGIEGIHFINNNNIGLSYDANSDEDFYLKFNILINNEKLHSHLKRNSQIIFEKNYSSHIINSEIEKALININNNF